MIQKAQVFFNCLCSSGLKYKEDYIIQFPVKSNYLKDSPESYLTTFRVHTRNPKKEISTNCYFDLFGSKLKIRHMVI